MSRRSHRLVLNVLLAVCGLTLWEFFSRRVFPGSSIPSPSSIVIEIWNARLDYTAHVAATLKFASLGFLLANGLAVLMAVLFLIFPRLRTINSFFTFVYSIPLILLVPILGMTLPSEAAEVICAVLLIFYPTLLATSVALAETPVLFVDLVRVAGGNDFDVFRLVRIRFGLAGLVAGLQAAAPFAILGAMLGELTGARWGLGAYLIAVMTQGQPAREWGVFLVCSAIAATAYVVIGMVVQPFRISLSASKSVRAATDIHGQPRARFVQILSNFAVTVVIWQICVMILSSNYFAKGPLDVLRFAFVLPSQSWQLFGLALADSLKWSALGLCAGVAAAFVFASVLDEFPFLSSVLIPIALVTQCVPIVALIPFYVALFGRGAITTVSVVVAATFFPAFVTIHQGLVEVPEHLVDVVQVSGGSNWSVFRYVKLPFALPFVFAAMRLAAPRVLLGVTLAEYLATRTGLGALLFEARGKTDFGMMWFIATATGVISLCFYWGVKRLEQATSRRLGRDVATVL